MDVVKQEIIKKYEKIQRKYSLKFAWMNAPLVIAYVLYVYITKPNQDDTTATLIPLLIYTGCTMILAIPYLLKVLKINKELKQKLLEIDLN